MSDLKLDLRNSAELPQHEVCGDCAKQFEALLDERISIVCADRKDKSAASIGFHLMELQRLLRGERVAYEQRVRIKQ